MSNLFINEAITPLTIETSISLSAATDPRILYYSPDGASGYWSATISGMNLVYNVLPGDISVVGNWRLQAYVVISGKPYYGEVVTQQFKLPL